MQINKRYICNNLYIITKKEYDHLENYKLCGKCERKLRRRRSLFTVINLMIIHINRFYNNYNVNNQIFNLLVQR